MGNHVKQDKRRSRRLLLITALATLAAFGGCSRCYFRESEDQKVTHLLEEKDKYPDWHIEQFHVYPDPRARFADESCPDHPPMPPDDPAADHLSPHPQNPGCAGLSRIEGTGYLDLLAEWDSENRAEAEKNKTDKDRSGRGGYDKGKDDKDGKKDPPPTPKGEKGEEAKLLETTEAAAAVASAQKWFTTSLMGPPRPDAPRGFLINLNQAVELGLINSREMQDQREELYLSSLPVTVERFAFMPQFFALNQAIRDYAGSQTPKGPSNNWTVNSNTGVAQLFATGALLLFNFANQTVVNLTGNGPRVASQSMINLNLVQPFLLGGGLAVNLEPLTQAERNLVYQIRLFARFRKTFYVAIAGGGGGSITGSAFQPTNVIAPSSFSPDAGFGSSGIVPGLVPPVTAGFPISGNPGLQVTPGPSGSVPLTTSLNAPVSGYLTTLQEAAQIQVDKYNIEKFEAFLNLAKAYKQLGDLSQLQVDQMEQQLLGGRRSLVNDQQDYLQTIDQFKLQLGIPPNILLELEDTPFRPLNAQLARYESLFNAYRAVTDEVYLLGAPEMLGKLRAELRRILTSSAVVQETRFRTQIEGRWDDWSKLTDDEIQKRLLGYTAERRKLLDRQTDLELKGQSLTPADQQRLDEINLEIEVAQFEQALRIYLAEPWKKLPEAAQTRDRRSKFGDVAATAIVLLTEARNERMKALHELWPRLQRVCVDGTDLMKGDLIDAETAATKFALLHRLDLMNVRAQLVDAWRQLAVFANALLGTFNVQYNLSSATPMALARPFAFSGARTTNQLVLNTELPLVRVREQANYRAALINFQRSRRILQRAEDEVQYDVRQELITLRQQEEFYRIQLRQIELAYMLVENSVDTLQSPPPTTTAGAQPADTATRAAALTNQLINAQNSLYNAQFAMTVVWITYLNTRLQLYRDMELMPFDFRGLWLDNVETCECPPDEKEQAGPKSEELPAPRPAGPPDVPPGEKLPKS